MGVGPWAQADLVRAVEKAERARFRRLVNKRIKIMRAAPVTDWPSGMVLEFLTHILKEITPAKKPMKFKKPID